MGPDPKKGTPSTVAAAGVSKIPSPRRSSQIGLRLDEVKGTVKPLDVT